MTSLKALGPQLAKVFHLSPDALYERQRALVRCGLLKNVGGSRGPGNGVRATPETVSTLMIAVMAATTLSETEEVTRQFGNLKPESDLPLFEGAKSLRATLIKALSSADVADSIKELVVIRTHRAAWVELRYPMAGEPDSVSFGLSKVPPAKRDGLTVMGSLPGEDILMIGELLQAHP